MQQLKNVAQKKAHKTFLAKVAILDGR